MEANMRVKRGQILKELRKQKSLSQSELSNFIGVSVQAYQKYEYGTAEPNFDTLCRLADFYGVTTDYLLGRKEPSNPIEQISDIELEQKFLQAYFDLISPQLRVKVWEQVAESLKNQIATEKDNGYIIERTTIGAELDRREEEQALLDATAKKTAV